MPSMIHVAESLPAVENMRRNKTWDNNMEVFSILNCAKLKSG